MPVADKIDWSRCSLVEIHPRVQSGAPVVLGTRLPVSAILDNFEFGVSSKEIASQFEVSEEIVLAILAYAKEHRIAHPSR